MDAGTPSYYLDDAIKMLRQKRREAEERRRAARVDRHGPTIKVGVAPGRPKETAAQRKTRKAKARGAAIRILKAQGAVCYLCGEPFDDARPATQDHVVPKALRGRTRGNILMAHQPCNNQKGDRMPTREELEYLRAVNAAVANDDVAGPRVFRCAAE